jgi:hypothetical protein
MEHYLTMRLLSYLSEYAKSTPIASPTMHMIDALRSGTTTRRAFWWKQDLFDIKDDNVLLREPEL